MLSEEDDNDTVVVSKDSTISETNDQVAVPSPVKKPKVSNKVKQEKSKESSDVKENELQEDSKVKTATGRKKGTKTKTTSKKKKGKKGETCLLKKLTDVIHLK